MEDCGLVLAPAEGPALDDHGVALLRIVLDGVGRHVIVVQVLVQPDLNAVRYMIGLSSKAN